MSLEKTKYQNVFQRTSTTRRNPHDGKADTCYYLTYRDQGKKVWEKVGWRSEGYTAQHASHLHADRIQAIRHGAPLRESEQPAAPMTFCQAWDLYHQKWLPNITSADHEHRRYEKHIAPRFADWPLEDIKPLHLESYKQDLLTQGLSPKTVQHILSLVRSVYKKLHQWELYDGRIPTASVKMPKVEMPGCAT